MKNRLRLPKISRLLHSRALALMGIWLVCLFPACGRGKEQSLAEAVGLLRQADSKYADGDYSAAAAKALEAANLVKDSAAVQQHAAQIVYLSGQAEASLPLFDRVIALVPESAPDNWQRGIALCSVGRFRDGAQQFKQHHDVNPDDVENSAWYFLCVAKSDSLEAARESVIPSRGDGRQPMMSVLQMLQGKLQPQQVLEAAIENTQAGPARNRAQFYAALYVGLYYDALGDDEQAIKHLKLSLGYGDSGYMVDTARVYLADRFKQSLGKGETTAK